MENQILNYSDGFVSILEIVLLFATSYLGSIIHEVLFVRGETKYIKNPRLWLTVIMNVVISYSIDPYIMEINFRLVLLPPLIFGLLGNELAIRLGTLKGSLSVIEYILGFFKIKNVLNKEDRDTIGINNDEVKLTTIKNNDENTNSNNNNDDVKNKPNEEKEQKVNNDTNLNTSNTNNGTDSLENNNKRYNKKANLDDILNRLQYILNAIDVFILDYYGSEEQEIDKQEYIDRYTKIKPQIIEIIQTLKHIDFIPISTAFKLSEIIGKEVEIDRIYRTLTQVTSK